MSRNHLFFRKPAGNPDTDGPIFPPEIPLVRGVIRIGGIDRIVRLKANLWSGLNRVAAHEDTAIDDICTHLDTARPDEMSLNNAIRLFLFFYDRFTPETDPATETPKGTAAFGNVW